MGNPLSLVYDKLIKGAENIMNNNEMVAKLIDEAAIKLGSFSTAFYNIQDQVVALVRMLKAWANKEGKGYCYNLKILYWWLLRGNICQPHHLV